MSVVQHSYGQRQALYLPPGISLPREQLATIQHILHQALRSTAPPPPPYDPRGAASQWYRPRMDMYEASGSIIAKFELPGMRKEDIHIDVVENNMIIVGQRNSKPTGSSKEGEEKEPSAGGNESSSSPEAMQVDEGAGYTVREIKHGKFRRAVPLPPGIKLEDVKATMHDGILTVTFPGAPRPVVHNIPVA